MAPGRVASSSGPPNPPSRPGGRFGPLRDAASRTWWTRERVTDRLRRFYREQGHAPTSTEAYHALVKGSGLGPRRRYPSTYAVLRWFPSFREAWAAVGAPVDRAWEPWSEAEDWYLREGAGILSRTALAADLGRSPDAVHRRLYDLGLHTYERHGWTPHRVERVAQVPAHVLRRSMDRGDLPYFRGSKVLYLDPADLLVVEEIDWAHPPPELEAAALRSLRQRLVQVLRGEDWRAARPHRLHPVSTTDHRRGPRLHMPGPRPTDIAAGDRVRCVRDVPGRPACAGRIGLVRLVYWSVNRAPHNPARAGSPGAAWVARVEFKKLRRLSAGPRVTYTLPLSVLERVDAEDAAGPVPRLHRLVCPSCGPLTICRPSPSRRRADSAPRRCRVPRAPRLRAGWRDGRDLPDPVQPREAHPWPTRADAPQSGATHPTLPRRPSAGGAGARLPGSPASRSPPDPRGAWISPTAWRYAAAWSA